MIKSTNNPSSNCHIIAVCSYSIAIDDEVGTLFAGVLSRPVDKAQVLTLLRKLGFQEKRSGRGEGGEDSRRGSGDA